MKKFFIFGILLGTIIFWQRAYIVAFSRVLLVKTGIKLQQSSKKGYALPKKENPHWSQQLRSLNISWFYTWSTSFNHEKPQDVEFVPMVWGAREAGLSKELARIQNNYQSGNASVLLTFNEPNDFFESNMTPQQAAELWPRLQALGVPLASPATLKPNDAWLHEFMSIAKRRNLRVDFLAVHWYGEPNAKEFLHQIDSLYEKYNLPIWITEFAVADWSVLGTKNKTKYSTLEVAKFMATVLPQLQTRTYVQRFAWKSRDPQDPVMGTSALFDNLGNLTWLGKLYASY